jgi:LmbE family N-acetylglucosaminyl deacetylase
MPEASERLRLMCVLAHPDDESLGNGGILAKYAAEGVDTYLVTATRGERGWTGDPSEDPGPEALGRVREAELREAARVLGVRELAFLDYVDGDLDKADPEEAISRIVGHIRRRRPHVVVTFGPDGAYGHPDHIAISQFTTAATVCAADVSYSAGNELQPHRVLKLYYMAVTTPFLEAYEAALGHIAMGVDGIEREGVAWPEWAITTKVDASDHWRTVWEAVACHRSQLPNYGTLAALSEEAHRYLWGYQPYYRAYSLVNGGRALERDLFEGIKEH